MSQPYSKFLEVFIEYVSKETGIISLKGFHASFPQFFITNSDDLEDIKGVWNNSFAKAIADLKVENFDNAQPNWSVIIQQAANRLRASLAENTSAGVKATSGSPKSPQSQRRSVSATTNANLPLTAENWELFEQKFKSMDPKRMWKVEDILVEKKVYEYAKSQDHEHAAHSFILDLADPCWKSVFTASQLKAIENQNMAPLAQLPTTMKEFFSKFKNIDDIDELRAIADNARFHYVDDFDADWAKRSIIDILTAYRFNVIKKIARYGKERDIMLRVWRSIDLAFDDLDVDIFRSDEQSAASSARVNEHRRGERGEVKVKVLGAKPDMIIAKDMLEFGSAEHGNYDEAGVGSKEQIEKFVKLPKTMKDMLLMLSKEVDHKEKQVRALRVIGLSHTHLRMSASIMDAPAGYICRARPLKEQKVPMSLIKFHETYIPFLEQVYRLKKVVKDCMELITLPQDGDDEERSGFASLADDDTATIILPSALNILPPSMSRKRKASELEADAN